MAARAAAEGQVGQGGSVVVDPEKRSVVFSRYYHVFVKGELDDLVLAVPEARPDPAMPRLVTGLPVAAGKVFEALLTLASSVKQVELVDSFFDSSNWCVVIRRTPK